MRAILGTKMRMTRVYSEDGTAVAATAIEAGPCPVVQVKTREKDGYEALQVGLDELTKKNLVNRPKEGHFKRAKVNATRHLREIPRPNGEDIQPGHVIKADIFKPGDRVDVTGTSKGKGFQGGVKRHNWHGGRATHGSHFHRRAGSIGAASTPSKVMKGKNMPGHMGHERITVQSLEVVHVDAENNLLFVKGAVPGTPGGLLIIKEAVKTKKGEE